MYVHSLNISSLSLILSCNSFYFDFPHLHLRHNQLSQYTSCAYYQLYFKIYLATHLPCLAAQRDDESVSESDPNPDSPAPTATASLALQLRMSPSLLPTSCHLVALAKSVAHVAACHFRICGQKSQKEKKIVEKAKKKQEKRFLYIFL